MIKSFFGAHQLRRKSFRLRRSVGIEGCARNVSAARPPSRADHLVRIRFPRDRIGTHTLWRATAGKPRHSKIEAAPEKMRWARFPNESRAELLEDGIAAD